MSLWSFWLAVCFSHRKNDERSYKAFHTVHFADTHSNTHTQDRFILQFKHLHKLGATVWRGILLPARLLLFYSSCKKRQWHGDVYKSLWAMRLNWLTADHIHISYPRSCCINGASVEYKEIQTHTLSWESAGLHSTWVWSLSESVVRFPAPRILSLSLCLCLSPLR